MQLALGASPVYTMWRIVQTELSLQRDVVVTLRAESTLGILPAVHWDRVPAMLQPRLRASLNRLTDSAYKELPTSVVDQCRQAACEVIGCWLKAHGEVNANEEYDLDQWIKKAADTTVGKEMYILADASNLVRRLHPRGKPNEQAKRQLREVTQGTRSLAS